MNIKDYRNEKKFNYVSKELLKLIINNNDC